MTSIPSQTQILVVGGGPGGSYAATVLAREGFSVVLLEAAKFPRYHIGESLLPSIRPFMRFIDAEELIGSQGYARKPGGAFKLSQSKKEGYTDFSPMIGSWNVARADFDDVLLRYAAECGANVYQETKVTELVFDGDRPVAALWKSAEGSEGRIDFDYLVDASGRNGIMSVKYLKNRRYNAGLKNIAVWGYWTGTGRYMPGTTRDNAIWVEALADESGWAWFIPLAGDVISVGIVEGMEKASAKKKRYDTADLDEKNYQFYMDEIKRAPGMMEFLKTGTMRGAGEHGRGIKTTSDFSYDADTYSGDHYRIVGDAGAFIDPLFSSGVHLALNSALSAAVTIASSIRGTVDETRASQWHSAKVKTAYTRFLVVVLGTYEQMCNQKLDIMSRVDEDNFDSIFGVIGPTIQGTVDIGKERSTEDVEKLVGVMLNFFATKVGVPEAQKVVESNPEGAVGDTSKEEINKLYLPKENFALEVFDGMTANIERHQLNLVAVA